jgi:hypothetical protein
MIAFAVCVIDAFWLQAMRVREPTKIGRAQNDVDFYVCRSDRILLSKYLKPLIEKCVLLLMRFGVKMYSLSFACQY